MSTIEQIPVLEETQENIAAATWLRFGRSPGTYAYPLALCLEITPHCNFDCTFCLNAWDIDEHSRQLLSTDDWYRILAQSISAGVQSFTFSGGEPTLRRDWRALLTYALDRGVRVELLTNGTNLETADVGLLRRLEEVQISLVSAKADVFSCATRTQGQYSRVMATLEQLSRSPVRLAVNCVLLPEAVADITEYLRLMEQLGIQRVTFSPFLPVGRASARRHSTLSTRQFSWCLEQIARWSDLNPHVSVGFVGPVPLCWVGSRRLYDRYRNKCVCGRMFAVVDPWGQLRACGCPGGPPGSVLENGLLALWNHPYMEKFRCGEFLPESCKKCEYLRECGSCAGMAVGRGVEGLGKPGRLAELSV